MRAHRSKTLPWTALICAAALVAACGSQGEDRSAPERVTGGDIQEWSQEADSDSLFGLPPMRGLEPKVQPETRVLDTADASGLTSVEVLNAAECVGRAALAPRCSYRIVLDPVPEGVKPGSVLVAGVTPQTPTGLLVRVDSVDGAMLRATEASLGDALAQGEFRVEQWYAPEQVTETRLAPGVTALPTEPEGGKGSAAGPRAMLLGEGMVFHYGVDQSPAPGVRVTGEAHFNAGCGLDAGISLSDGPWFWAGCELHEATGLAVTVAAGAAAVGETYRLADFDLKPIIVAIGPVPVVVVPHLSLAVRIDGSLATGIDFGAEETVLGTLKAGYDDGFYAKADIDVDSDARHEMPGAKVGSALGGEMGVEMLLYGIVGPKLWGIGHMEFDGAPGQKPAVCYDLRAGLGVSVVLDLKVKEWEWRPGWILDRRLDAGCRANEAPTVAISSPTEGAVITVGTTVTPQLTATATDPEDGVLPVTWTSNVDGVLGTGTGPVPVGFKTMGPQTLTATAQDPEGLTAQAVVHITVAQPTWSLTTAVTSLTGAPVALSGGVLKGRPGEAYYVKAKPSAPPTLAQPTCAQVTWTATLPLQDKGNCLARISLDAAGSYSVTAAIKPPWGGSVTSTLPVQVAAAPPPTTGPTAPPTGGPTPPPPAPAPQFEGIIATVSGVQLSDNDVIAPGQVATLKVLYRNAAQARVPVAYAWAYQTDGGAWTAIAGTDDTGKAQSTRTWSTAVNNPHQYVLRCVITPASGGGALTTLTLRLRYLGRPL